MTELLVADLLPLIWLIILGLAITLYVLLDGFSLGMGILFPFAKSDENRDVMMASVAPVWDGNQTWLVGGGTALFTAFPKAFHLLMGVLYLPLMFMLIALVFRGVAFEFRFKAKQKQLWDKAFVGGSWVAAFCQGLVLGTYVQGFSYDGEILSSEGIFSAFSIFTGFAVIAAYGLLGSCWLIMKTEGELQQRAQKFGRILLPVISIGIVIVSLWTPYAIPSIGERWFAWPNIILLSPIPLWTAGLLALLAWALYRSPKWEPTAFFACIGLYLLTITGLAISIFPDIVPQVFDFAEVAAPESSLLLALVGVLFIVPVILLYTAHNYYVFRGKTDVADVYH